MTFKQTELVSEVVRMGVDENSPIPRDQAWPGSVHVESDIGQAIIRDRVVLFGRLGKLVDTCHDASEKGLHLFRSRFDAI